MQPSPTEIGTYILSKTVNLKPGENSIYFIVISSEGSTTSEKRYIICPSSSLQANQSSNQITSENNDVSIGEIIVNASELKVLLNSLKP